MNELKQLKELNPELQVTIEKILKDLELNNSESIINDVHLDLSK